MICVFIHLGSIPQHWSDGLIHPSSSSITHVSRGWKVCIAAECSTCVHVHVKELWLGHLSTVGWWGISGSMLQFVAQVAFDLILFSFTRSGSVMRILRIHLLWSQSVGLINPVWVIGTDQILVPFWLKIWSAISFWELSRPPLAPWWFIIYHCEGRRCLLRSFLFHWCAVICSGESRSDFTWAQFIFWHYLLSEVITSSQIEVILVWGFIYLCRRSRFTSRLHLWWVRQRSFCGEVLFIRAEGVDLLLVCICDDLCFYSFGVDPPALIWWADPPIFILNHPRLQRTKSLHSGRAQCMCSHARQRTVIDIYI